jgi:hypothetical protein
MKHYECHITTRTPFAVASTEIAKELHWKTSEIARDPVLGNDTYFYLTTHDTDLGRMLGRMQTCVARMKEAGVEVVREKIEEIIHDTKLGLSVSVNPSSVSSRVNPMAAWPFPTRTGPGISE